jgi:hypothetical protein
MSKSCLARSGALASVGAGVGWCYHGRSSGGLAVIGDDWRCGQMMGLVVMSSAAHHCAAYQPLAQVSHGRSKAGLARKRISWAPCPARAGAAPPASSLLRSFCRVVPIASSLYLIIPRPPCLPRRRCCCLLLLLQSNVPGPITRIRRPRTGTVVDRQGCARTAHLQQRR